MKTHVWLLALTVMAGAVCAVDLDPLQMKFHRQAARRFMFSQEIKLGELVPGEILALDAMHPPGAKTCQIKDGKLIISAGDSALTVSGVNPFATHFIDIDTLPAGAEIAAEFADIERGNGVAVAVSASAAPVLRVFKNGALAREQTLEGAPAPAAPFTLVVQLYGVSVGVFAVKDGQTVSLGALPAKENFAADVDFRRRAVFLNSTFNLTAKVPGGASVIVSRARAVLSSGIGQADIRAITRADGEPFIENNRLWFTFSCRGLGTADACQGVMSLDPSVFDPRFEGVIVFDRGDGVLRNDYAAHLFYDDNAREWRAFVSCFSVDPRGRGETGLAVARSTRDPRRGFSVMEEKQLTAQQLQIPLRHEDPSVLFDADADKWRLLTCAFEKEGLRAMLFESDNWDGPYRKISGPVPHDSTGTQIQKIGNRRYVFSGAKTVPGEDKRGGILIYTYPDLNYLGELKSDLPSTLKGGRVWPNIFRLPPGYPAEYMALQMDRMNFPGVKMQNWSYGALYLFWANTGTD
ncbi:MAG: hypothetical protein LBD30_03930 [Verrucomicrobiales bacterium]|jgi:hypothetical protein|nr:hypothetical protein [Verrucomicrobiales bacterium]